MSWRRARRVPPKSPCPKRKARFLRAIRRIRTLEKCQILFADECGLCLQPSLPYLWQRPGQRVGLPSSAHSRRINIVGFLKADGTCLHHFTTCQAVKAEFFIECIDALIAKKMGPTVVVVDNAGVHTSKAVKACRSRWRAQGLRLLYLPPYSPQLNPIELLWRNLKYRWLPVGAYQDFQTLCQCVTDILNAYSKNYTLTFRT